MAARPVSKTVQAMAGCVQQNPSDPRLGETVRVVLTGSCKWFALKGSYTRVVPTRRLRAGVETSIQPPGSVVGEVDRSFRDRLVGHSIPTGRFHDQRIHAGIEMSLQPRATSTEGPWALPTGYCQHTGCPHRPLYTGRPRRAWPRAQTSRQGPAADFRHMAPAAARGHLCVCV